MFRNPTSIQRSQQTPTRPCSSYCLYQHNRQLCRAAQKCDSQPQQSQWANRVLSAGLAAAIAASALLSPALVPPPARAHEGMEHSAAVGAQPGTAAAEFRCTPLTSQERASSFQLNGFTHRIHTSSPEAQALFDQGLLLTYNFNRPEAIKSFQTGLEFDPHAAMLHWGVAHAQGPYANKVWGVPPSDGSYDVTSQAEVDLGKQEAKVGLASARAALASSPDDPLLQTELSYLEAVDRLWGGVRGAGDTRFNTALKRYAQDLESIAAVAPGDPDAPALAAEARMNLSPWVHWKGPLGRRTPVQPDTVVLPALRDISAAFSRRSGHPMAAHLMIHLTEAATPGSSEDVPAAPGYAALAESGADLLSVGPAFPDMGHLVHMPSHTYLRVGRWHDAVTANQAALQADENIVKRCVDPYMPEHNSQLLLYAAMNSGELAEAERAAQHAMDFPRIFGPNNMADGRERASKSLIQARFAKWSPLLELQQSELDYSRDGVMVPPGTEQWNQGVWHYVRALAAAAAAHQLEPSPPSATLLSTSTPTPASSAPSASSSRQEFEQLLSAELKSLSAAVAATPPDPLTRPGEGIGIYSPGFKRLGQIELLVAQARADVLHGSFSSAANKLRAAVAKEGEMGYTEPPRQYQPMRECLGWVLLQQGKLAEAEKAYLDDLSELPNNPWSLTGLKQVYQQQGSQAADKLKRVESRLAVSWAHADPGLTLSSSCPSFSD